MDLLSVFNVVLSSWAFCCAMSCLVNAFNQRVSQRRLFVLEVRVAGLSADVRRLEASVAGLREQLTPREEFHEPFEPSPPSGFEDIEF